MRGSRARKAAVVTIAGLLAGATAAVTATAVTATAVTAKAATANGPSWRIVKQVHSGGNGQFTAVTAVGKNGGWAFNGIQAPTAWERDGSSWKQVAFPGQKGGEEVIAAAATSASDVWAFTDGTTKSRVLRWNGHAWSVVRTFTRAIGGAAVVNASDVWVFGEPFFPSAGFGAWNYNGHAWTQVKGGGGLEGGSATSANDVWAFDGADVANWNGKTWTRTSVAHLLPAKQELNDPAVTGIYAYSKNNVYAIGNGNLQDDGGPVVVLHYNGRTWTRVAEGNYGYGTQPLQQIATDGHGGLWLPMPGVDGQQSHLLHYAGGHLTQATLPVSASKINVDAIARIPGTADMLAGGDTHAASNPGTGVVSVLLQYGS
jgi:hypothetical protein